LADLHRVWGRGLRLQVLVEVRDRVVEALERAFALRQREDRRRSMIRELVCFLKVGKGGFVLFGLEILRGGLELLFLDRRAIFSARDGRSDEGRDEDGEDETVLVHHDLSCFFLMGDEGSGSFLCMTGVDGAFGAAASATIALS